MKKKHKQEILKQAQKNLAALKIQLKTLEKHYGKESEKYKNALEQKNEAEAETKSAESALKEASDNATRTLATLIEFLKEMTENCEENSPSKSRSFKDLSSPTPTLITDREEDEEDIREEARENEEAKEETKENESSEEVSHLSMAVNTSFGNNTSSSIASLSTAAAVLEDLGGDEYGLGFRGLFFHHGGGADNCG